MYFAQTICIIIQAYITRLFNFNPHKETQPKINYSTRDKMLQNIKTNHTVYILTVLLNNNLFS